MLKVHLDALRKPLFFVSRRNFSNLSVIMDLETTVSDVILKLISHEENSAVIKRLKEIRSSFKDFDSKEQEEKKSIVINALKAISELTQDNGKSSLSDLEQQPSEHKGPGRLCVTDQVRYVKGVGPRLSAVLAKRGVVTIEDLLFYFPRKYEDRRNVQTISSVRCNSKCIVIGTVSRVKRIPTRKSGSIYRVMITDPTGSLDLIWFNANRRYIEGTYRKGVKVVVSGEVTFSSYNRCLQIIHPKPQDIEILEDTQESEDQTHFNRIVPIYSLTEGLTQRRMRGMIKAVVEKYADKLTCSIPQEIISRCSLMDLSQAIREVHFPEKFDEVVDLDDAVQVEASLPHKTVIFFEFLMLELGLGLKKRSIVKKKGTSFINDGDLVRRFTDGLPFELTHAQKKVIQEIKSDMSAGSPMNRLVQGDVGSGKTIVSIISILNAVESGYQAVIMAPTEILCEQHYRSITGYLIGLDINVVLLKSALSTAERRRVTWAIHSGWSHIIVGTHALIQDNVEFARLGLVVIDEQHRFGVVQRAKLMDKSSNPDSLVLTATPIPRTLAITVYGDLDVSVIDELPLGRKKIQTSHYRDKKESRSELYGRIRSELTRGRQGYFICPFIEESDNPEFKHVKHVGKVYEELKNDVFAEFNVGFLHGQMSSDEKEEVMQGFLKDEINVLVSTTVVEVGVDVPNATFMVIENAERYGLSQLHQLRGRIGRSDLESFCMLVSGRFLSEEAEKKLSIMTQTSDGFKIAEADLRMRGPGDFLGTKQSGIPQFKLANLVRDWKLLNKARDTSFGLISEDPELDGYGELKEYVKSRWADVLGFKLIS